jgi:hypothetical protein
LEAWGWNFGPDLTRALKEWCTQRFVFQRNAIPPADLNFNATRMMEIKGRTQV